MNCCTVVFSNKAYNAIIGESFKKDPVETGGILLGYIIDDTWIVMEVLPPGIHCIFQEAYFEYDTEFVNYLADTVSNQYENPLILLGLWHRHPGNLDVFSGTDDITNATFARQNPYGVISGIVNIDPKLRLTMYHLDNTSAVRAHSSASLKYTKVDVVVGDDIIPQYLFNLKFINNEESDLHPSPSKPKSSVQYPNRHQKDNAEENDDILKKKVKVRRNNIRNLFFAKIALLIDIKKQKFLYFLLGIIFTMFVGACYFKAQKLIVKPLNSIVSSPKKGAHRYDK